MRDKNQPRGWRGGMGWIPDYPDFRDYTVQQEEIKPMIKAIGIAGSKKEKMPASVDLRSSFPPIENQGWLGSCTANAGVAMVEYYERKAFGKHIDAARLFLYKTTRNLLHLAGDTGASLRATMGAMVLFGVPPEEYWPYVIEDFDKEPPAFCYAFAQNYQSIKYFRLDPPDTAKDVLLKRIKIFLSNKLPCMFGFSVFGSIENAIDDGKIPYPGRGERILGGHAIVAAGFDDRMKVRNPTSGKETTGALLVRNSWSREWGEQGYGWLPYEYVLKGLAIDWWSVLKSEWVDTGEFGL